MYFCDDIDLLPWEPGIFLQDAFAHQLLFKDATGALTASALVMDAPTLANVTPGMVARVTTADDSLSQLLEIVDVADPSHATLSALRGRNSESPIPPLAGGSVKVSVLTFHPQIAAVGDQLLALLGIASDRLSEPAPASANLAGFRLATVFGVLAALYRTLADATAASSLTFAKKTFYEQLAHAARRAISASVDTDGDGVPDARVRADAPVLLRA